ncbi:MAG: sodium:calcium antiporter, partial [Candidatus Cloacimonetes bacterium]|nr:sodium:calcium antiporter [Candidatus Cloacimonadota bacterium]
LTMIFLLSGLILLIVGGRIIVNSAERFAHDIGISQRIIALTIVSLGTSLPEIATSIVAAIKRNVDIAIGNVVGSNIFNAFFILGVSAIINPVEMQKGSNLDLSLNLLASALLFLFIFTGRGRKLDRWEGIIFIIIYIAYIYLLIKP